MTAHQILTIPLDQLRPGMYVGNVFNDRGVLLYSANTLIKSYSQIESLRRQGVVSIAINLQRGDGSQVVPAESNENETTSTTPAAPAVTDVFDSTAVQQAFEMRNNALDTVHNVMASARMGRLFSIGTIASTVESIIDTMFDEPDLLLNLCQMKTHSTATYIHSVNVAVLMVGFTSALGFSRDRIREAGVGGMIHDIGKVRLPVELLLRQGTCTRQENELIKRHPDIGVDIIKKNGSVVSQSILKMIGQHHEQLNGGGYPRGLSDNKIDEMAFICAIADRYDLLTTQGMYQRLYLPQEALALIFQGSDVEYPRELVEHFTKLLGIYPVGSFVKLDTGEMGIVIKNNRNKLLAPVVKVLFDTTGVRLVTPYIKDLASSENQTEERQIRVLNSLDPLSFNVTTDHYYLQA